MVGAAAVEAIICPCRSFFALNSDELDVLNVIPGNLLSKLLRLLRDNPFSWSFS
jgi:hypothetical protein